jgi:predicted phosphodiesterase
MKYDSFLESFRQFLSDCPEESLDDSARYVFLSDLHMGDGSSRDDLEDNRELIELMLADWYLERDYVLVLNGDIEDLNKFSLQSIRAAWPDLLEIIDRFAKRGKLRKIVGNHDFDLLAERNYPWRLYQGLIYRVGDNRLFAFHGHQASSRYVKYDFISEFLVRYLVKPLHIHNTGVSKDSRRRFATERKIYRAARSLGVVAVAGHTHRPLFESLSKYDNIRLTLEGLLRQYIDADYGEREALESQICLYRDEMLKLANVKEKSKKNAEPLRRRTVPHSLPFQFGLRYRQARHNDPGNRRREDSPHILDANRRLAPLYHDGSNRPDRCRQQGISLHTETGTPRRGILADRPSRASRDFPVGTIERRRDEISSTGRKNG